MQPDATSTNKTVAGVRYPQNPASLINLSKYPLSRLGSPEGARLIAECHERLSTSGVCVLKEFILPAALDSMVAEARDAEPDAYFGRSSHNAYLQPSDKTLPAEHPRNFHLESSAGSIACDRLGADSTLRGFYAWDPLVSFMGAVFGNQRIYRSADPLGAVSIDVFREGHRHAWHFDELEYTTSLMLQASEEGGLFEYVPNTRPNGNDTHETLTRILRDEHNDVSRPATSPGDLLVFSGRRSIHRVTEVRGHTSRLAAVLCFSKRPNAVNSEEVRRLIWGRTQ
ncbi:MAG TPA: hypothetical protein VIT83_05035 [Gammaproteobacteria bacterium]